MLCWPICFAIWARITATMSLSPLATVRDSYARTPSAKTLRGAFRNRNEVPAATAKGVLYRLEKGPTSDLSSPRCASNRGRLYALTLACQTTRRRFGEEFPSAFFMERRYVRQA